jgi:DNA adenine methylase
MMQPKRAALRYFGGKWKLAPWIINQFPSHKIYVEPFGGGGSVLIRKPESFLEVYNDLNGDIVNFFKVLREQPNELIRAIELTPLSREEFIKSQIPAEDPIERARRIYVLAWQGRGRVGIVEPGSWRNTTNTSRSKTAAEDWDNVHHLYIIAKRLKNVQLENDDYNTIIRRYDSVETLFYLDPPYLQHTRSKRWKENAYLHEFTQQQHEDLAQILHNIQGYAIISGYPSQLYDDLYRDWKQLGKMGYSDNGNNQAIEKLWINKLEQLPLFQFIDKL